LEKITGNITLQQIFCENWLEFCQLHSECLNDDIHENVEKMMKCRDPDQMGFIQYTCPFHPEHSVRVPCSCKSRFCNTCGKIATDEWISNCNQILPNIEYRHLTLTIPQELRNLFFEIRPLLSCLFTAGSNLLKSFFLEKHITVAMTMILHTFGRKLNWNPHIHAIVSCGGLTDDLQWKDQDYIPYKMLRERWKVKLLNCLKKTILEILGNEVSLEKLKPFSDTKVLNTFFSDLYRIDWYAHLSQEKIDMDHTIGYIGRYSRRPVVSEAKILDYDRTKQSITFEYQDHKEKTPTKWTLHVHKFMKLLIQHIPQKYFHQIRHYGLVANSISKKCKPILKKLFGIAKQMLQKLLWRQRQKKLSGNDPLSCPKCKSEMIISLRAFFSQKKGKLIFF
jgi:hypothetical protein